MSNQDREARRAAARASIQAGGGYNRNYIKNVEAEYVVAANTLKTIKTRQGTTMTVFEMQIVSGNPENPGDAHQPREEVVFSIHNDGTTESVGYYERDLAKLYRQVAGISQQELKALTSEEEHLDAWIDWQDGLADGRVPLAGSRYILKVTHKYSKKGDLSNFPYIDFTAVEGECGALFETFCQNR